MDEFITTYSTIPLSKWQKFLNVFRRAFGLLVRGETQVIHTEPKNPFGLLVDSQRPTKRAPRG